MPYFSFCPADNLQNVLEGTLDISEWLEKTTSGQQIEEPQPGMKYLNVL